MEKKKKTLSVQNALSCQSICFLCHSKILFLISAWKRLFTVEHLPCCIFFLNKRLLMKNKPSAHSAELYFSKCFTAEQTNRQICGFTHSNDDCRLSAFKNAACLFKMISHGAKHTGTTGTTFFCAFTGEQSSYAWTPPFHPWLKGAVWLGFFFYLTKADQDKEWQRSVLTNVAPYPQVDVSHIPPDSAVMNYQPLGL